MRTRVAVVACTLVVAAACGRGKAAATDSAAAPATAAAASTPGGVPTCQRTGHWSECTVRIKLDQAGLAPQTGADKVGDLPKLAMKPFTLTIGNAGIAYYVYADTVSRHAAAAALDTNKFIPQAKPVSMKNETTLIQNDNVLVLLFSKNEHQRERVSDIIMGGPPQ